MSLSLSLSLIVLMFLMSSPLITIGRIGKVTLHFTSVINDAVTRSPIELLGSGTAKTFVTVEIFIFDHNLPFSGISGLKIMRGIFQVYQSD